MQVKRWTGRSTQREHSVSTGWLFSSPHPSHPASPPVGDYTHLLTTYQLDPLIGFCQLLAGNVFPMRGVRSALGSEFSLSFPLCSCLCLQHMETCICGCWKFPRTLGTLSLALVFLQPWPFWIPLSVTQLIPWALLPLLSSFVHFVFQCLPVPWYLLKIRDHKNHHLKIKMFNFKRIFFCKLLLGKQCWNSIGRQFSQSVFA